MATRTLAGIYGLVAISITIWLESRGMKLESQIFLWTAVVLLGPIGIGWVTREFRQRWFWVALAASCIVHTALEEFQKQSPSPKRIRITFARRN